MHQLSPHLTQSSSNSDLKSSLRSSLRGSLRNSIGSSIRNHLHKWKGRKASIDTSWNPAASASDLLLADNGDDNATIRPLPEDTSATKFYDGNKMQWKIPKQAIKARLLKATKLRIRAPRRSKHEQKKMLIEQQQLKAKRMRTPWRSTIVLASSPDESSEVSDISASSYGSEEEYHPGFRTVYPDDGNVGEENDKNTINRKYKDWTEREVTPPMLALITDATARDGFSVMAPMSVKSLTSDSSAGYTSKLMQGQLARHFAEVRDSIEIALEESRHAVRRAIENSTKSMFKCATLPCAQGDALAKNFNCTAWLPTSIHDEHQFEFVDTVTSALDQENEVLDPVILQDKLKPRSLSIVGMATEADPEQPLIAESQNSSEDMEYSGNRDRKRPNGIVQRIRRQQRRVTRL
ncbi:hypothetical protein ACA910_006265 [Epithemia clementina (nom. ined.)]